MSKMGGVRAIKATQSLSSPWLLGMEAVSGGKNAESKVDATVTAFIYIYIYIYIYPTNFGEKCRKQYPANLPT